MSQVHVDILRRARQLIENEQEEFICHSILEFDCPERYQIRNKIEELLYPHSTYGCWLMRNHPDRYVNGMFAHVEGRLQWIDWMIANHHIFDNASTKV